MKSYFLARWRETVSRETPAKLAMSAWVMVLTISISYVAQSLPVI